MIFIETITTSDGKKVKVCRKQRSKEEEKRKSPIHFLKEE